MELASKNDELCIKVMNFALIMMNWLQVRFFECSAKTGDSVYDAFVNLASDQLEEKAKRAEGGSSVVCFRALF